MGKMLIRQHYSRMPVLQAIGDALTIGVTLYISQWLVGQPPSDRSYVAILSTILLFLVSAEFTGLYRSGLSRSADRELVSLFSTWVMTLLLLSSVAFFSRHGEHFARSSILSWIVLAGAGLGLVRMLLRMAVEMLFHQGLAVRRCAIAGLNPLGVQFAENAQSTPENGLSIVGFFDDRVHQRLLKSVEGKLQLLGRLDDLAARARQGEFDTVFITLPMRAEARIRWLLEQLADSTANAYIVPDFFVFELLHSRWTQINGLPAVSIFETPLYGVDGWSKRAFDLILATCGLVVLLPVMLWCAVLVKLSSPGPIFFRQRRYGLDGREILVWKFRSMRACDNGPVVNQATKEDPRITPIGRILRKTSLDELPQLFNVIEGSMSLVGPRPHASAHNEHYRKLIRGYMLRHKVKPGITGLAQVEGFRGETETLDKMQARIDMDHRYIREWSIWLDMRIIFRTFAVVLKQENAY